MEGTHITLDELKEKNKKKNLRSKSSSVSPQRLPFSSSDLSNTIPCKQAWRVLVQGEGSLWLQNQSDLRNRAVISEHFLKKSAPKNTRKRYPKLYLHSCIIMMLLWKHLFSCVLSAWTCKYKYTGKRWNVGWSIKICFSGKAIFWPFPNTTKRHRTCFQTEKLSSSQISDRGNF